MKCSAARHESEKNFRTNSKLLHAKKLDCGYKRINLNPFLAKRKHNYRDKFGDWWIERALRIRHVGRQKLAIISFNMHRPTGKLANCHNSNPTPNRYQVPPEWCPIFVQFMTLAWAHSSQMPKSISRTLACFRMAFDGSKIYAFWNICVGRKAGALKETGNLVVLANNRVLEIHFGGSILWMWMRMRMLHIWLLLWAGSKATGAG